MRFSSSSQPPPYIQLEDLSSKTSLPLQRTQSISSLSTTATTATNFSGPLIPASKTTVPFIASTTLQIQTTGHTLINLPTPVRDLTIPIFSLSPSPSPSNTINSAPTPSYLSIRPTRSSGNSKLILTNDANDEKVLAETIYRFGPGRDPEVRIFGSGNIRDEYDGSETFKLTGSSLLSRSVKFESRGLGKMEWRYGSKSERFASSTPEVGKVDNLLILECLAGSGERRRIAQFIRGDGTRTPGSKKSSAGNGGRLEISMEGLDGFEEVVQVIVLATCLVMLKKEIDRLRSAQIAVIGFDGGKAGLIWACCLMVYLNAEKKKKEKLKGIEDARRANEGAGETVCVE